MLVLGDRLAQLSVELVELLESNEHNLFDRNGVNKVEDVSGGQTTARATGDETDTSDENDTVDVFISTHSNCMKCREVVELFQMKPNVSVTVNMVDEEPDVFIRASYVGSGYERIMELQKSGKLDEWLRVSSHHN